MFDVEDLTLEQALKNARGHFRTITEHKLLVLRFCLRCGLLKQGLMHDNSKYSPAEFIVGVRYYQGDRSPNDIDRRTHGYSGAWMHHKGRNRHHYEYWNDYIPPGENNTGGGVGPVPMPRRYIAEMFCDRLAACHVYNKDNYSDDLALKYYSRSKGRGRMLIHPDTDRDLYFLLKYCSSYGEEQTFQYIRKIYLRGERSEETI